MKYDLTKPCSGCPFLKDGTGVRLNKGRIISLAQVTAKGGAFICHKTASHEDEAEELDEDTGDVRKFKRYDPREQHCAGAMIFALNAGDQLSQVVVEMRTAHLPENFAKLEANKGLVYEHVNEWLEKGSF